MKKVSVNVLSVINSSSKISKETIDNKEHFVIKDVVPVIDDVVMNGGLYPKDEVDKGYLSINGNLMPMGHPKIGKQYISASDPRAINEFYGGAWAENVRKDNDKVLLDAYVDIEFANNHKKGKQLIERLEKMVNGEDTSPIHVSTGLVLNKEYTTGKSKGKPYTWIARNMQFDHVAILLDEPGAATPDEGVGIFVNSEGEHDIEDANLLDAVNFTKDGLINKVKFFFSNNSDMSFDEVYRLISDKLNSNSTGDNWSYVDAIYPTYFIYGRKNEQFKQTYLIDENQQVNFVGEAVEVKKTVVYDEIKTNGENQAMKNMILNALNAKGIKTDGLTDEQLLAAFNEETAKDALAKKKEDEEKEKDKKDKEKAQNEQTPEWAKTLISDVNSLKQTVTSNAETEAKAMREAVKAKFGMTDVAVNALSGEPLKELYAQCNSSTSINPSFQQNGKDTFSDMPE